MSDPLFQEAYARARRRFTDSGWMSLSPREITEAIYGEIRQIDAERLAVRASIDPDSQKGPLKAAAKEPVPVGGIARKPRAKVATSVSRSRPAPQLG